MHLTELLGKWRWLLPGLCSCIHGTSVTTFIVAQVKADRNPQDTISYHKIDPYASRCVIRASPMVHSRRPLQGGATLQDGGTLQGGGKPRPATIHVLYHSLASTEQIWQPNPL